jgi:hypothetical protein
MKNISKALFLFFVILAITTCSTYTLSNITLPIIGFNSPEDSSNFFLYIPNNQTMADYISMHLYLRAWDMDQITVDDKALSAIFINNFGQNTMHSLLFESFLRYTKNVNIQQRVLKYIDNNNIETGFTSNLRKLYAANPVIKTVNGKNITQYIYNNKEYDENINLFNFNEVGFFNGELGLLLFENDWGLLTVNNSNQNNEESILLTYGGGTNSILIILKKYSNLNENDINSKLRIDYYNKRFNGNWKINGLPPVGILGRSGADRFIIAHGHGAEEIPTIQAAIFNTYLYNKNKKALYEISYYMNFSPININYSERDRIFNLLFFQSLFVYLKNS